MRGVEASYRNVEFQGVGAKDVGVRCQIVEILTCWGGQT